MLHPELSFASLSMKYMNLSSSTFPPHALRGVRFAIGTPMAIAFCPTSIPMPRISRVSLTESFEISSFKKITLPIPILRRIISASFGSMPAKSPVSVSIPAPQYFMSSQS